MRKVTRHQRCFAAIIKNLHISDLGMLGSEDSNGRRRHSELYWAAGEAGLKERDELIGDHEDSLLSI
jgi:hypothetical protein